MKEHPILFSGAMVRAILEGRKTQTRRLVKPQPEGRVCWMKASNGLFFYDQWDGTTGREMRPCPYGQPGDRLIVASEIPGAPDAYCAGSDGVIYSRARDRSKWAPLKTGRHKKGYLTVSISDPVRWGPGGKRTVAVHTLVCSAFYGRPAEMGMQVRHLDGNAENCRPENLAWGTQAENWRDRRAHGNGCEGEKHHAAKFSNDERAHIRWAVQRGLTSQRHAARVLGVAQSTIQQMLSGAELMDVPQELPEGRIPPLTLEVVSVRVERLQEISEEDAKREGVATPTTGGFYDADLPMGVDQSPYMSAVRAFRDVWQHINAARGFGWDANPWVWVVEFRRVGA